MSACQMQQTNDQWSTPNSGIEKVLETEKQEGEEWIFLSSKDGNLLRFKYYTPYLKRNLPASSGQDMIFSIESIRLSVCTPEFAWI